MIKPGSKLLDLIHTGMPSVEHVKNQLRANFSTGELFWLDTAKARQMRGKKAGSLNSANYILVRVNGRQIVASRIIWALAHGEWPPVMIDHINGDTTDDKLSNLRLATQQQNNMNHRKRPDNVSGITGVHPMGPNKWRAQIRIRNKPTYLGVYTVFEEAVMARRAAEILHFGEFRRKEKEEAIA